MAPHPRPTSVGCWDFLVAPFLAVGAQFDTLSRLEGPWAPETRPRAQSCPWACSKTSPVALGIFSAFSDASRKSCCSQLAPETSSAPLGELAAARTRESSREDAAKAAAKKAVEGKKATAKDEKAGVCHSFFVPLPLPLLLVLMMTLLPLLMILVSVYPASSDYSSSSSSSASHYSSSSSP